MTVYVTAIHPVATTTHQGIDSIRWLNSSDSTSNTMSKAQAVSWLNNGNNMYVAGETGPVEVKVIQGNPPYLRTVKDNTPTDNLLELPRF